MFPKRPTHLPRPESPTLDEPVAGSALTWGRDGALLGGLLPVSILMSNGMLWWMYEPSVLVFVLVSSGLAGAVGLVYGGAVERMRGHVPLALLGLLAITLASGVGMAAGWASELAGGMPDTILWGATVPPLLVALLWLPYTMTRVLRWRSWPLLVVACLGAAPATKFAFVAFQWLAVL